MKLTDEIKPIYLGFETSTKKYYFYFIKEGVPRFLVYSAYFFWGVGPQSVLSLQPIPEEVENDLSQFLSGNLEYEFIKKRKNSKQKTAFKVYRAPKEVTQPEIAKSIRNKRRNDNVSCSNSRRSDDGGNTGSGRIQPVLSSTSGLSREHPGTLTEIKVSTRKKIIKKLQLLKSVVEVVAVPEVILNVKPKRKYTRKQKS